MQYKIELCADTFEDYLPAYRADLQLEYSWNRGESRLLWEHARQAMRAAWDRVDRA